MVLPVVLSLFGPASSSLEDSESDDEDDDEDVISSSQQQRQQNTQSKNKDNKNKEMYSALPDEEGEVKKPVLGSNGAFRESTI